jgi:DNA polymerase I-like protein with 3'-5' exonuclease and polymerase domains
MLKPLDHRGYKLFHEGTIALAEVEHNGIKMDLEYLHKTIAQVKTKTTKQQQSLVESKIGKEWKKRFGGETKMGSRTQLATLLFDTLGYKCPDRTEDGKIPMEEPILRDMNIGFVNDWLTWQKWMKVESTYLRGLLKHITKSGFLHPSFSLNTTLVYRSSSQDPNFQNIPIRDDEFAKLIRRAFIARNMNYYFGESDFSGAEVCISCSYHKDPKMIHYVTNPKSNMHFDMALQIFMLTRGQMVKPIRDHVKNKFVFPQFYGDYYYQCAKLLWEAIRKFDLRTEDETPLKLHLRRNGIRRFGPKDPKDRAMPGTFVHHMREVEKDFWGNRFRVYSDWKDEWWYRYLENGYCDTYTGFRFESAMNKKHVCNYPIQGSAFHCLLWCLIRIVKLLRKYKMKTRIIGQIHDSIVSDIYYKEKRQFLEMVQEVMSVELMKHWKWIIVPMKVDSEISTRGGSWFTKEKFEL